MNPLELDQEISKLARAMMTRNRDIGLALIAYLRTELSVECVAGVLIVSIERVIWFDTDSVMWAIEHLIPNDMKREIHKLMAFTVYKQLVAKGYVPGKDMSVDGNGRLLIKSKYRAAA